MAPANGGLVPPEQLHSGIGNDECEKPIPAFAPFDPSRLSEHVRTLASDRFGGREPGTDGETLTIGYISRQFASAGLRPGGDFGGWTQAVPLNRFELAGDKNLDIATDRGSMQLRSGTDWAGGSLTGLTKLKINSAPLVFVGYGISAPERGWDDYKRADLHGKIAVFLINDPDFETSVPGAFNGKAMTYYGRWTYKFEEAARRGAAGALIVHEDLPAGYGWPTVENSWTAAQYDIQRTNPLAAHPLLEGWLTREAAERLFGRAGYTLSQLKQMAERPDFAPVALGNERLSISTNVKIEKIMSHNVIGVLPGSTRKSESVVYSAHWDHLGIGHRNASGDKIFHGAVDNAIGVAGLLELARVFAHEPRTARSLFFIAFTAEEKGLLGSKYYVLHPRTPLAVTAAVFNMDTFNPHGPACDVQVWSTLQNTLEDNVSDAAVGEGRQLTPDEHLEAGYFYRADHFPFAQLGVPAITVGSGWTLYAGGRKKGDLMYRDYFSHDYHQPSDTWSADWDLRGVAIDLRLLHDVGRSIADSNSWPQWFQDSEFRIVRNRSNAKRLPKPLKDPTE